MSLVEVDRSDLSHRLLPAQWDRPKKPYSQPVVLSVEENFDSETSGIDAGSPFESESIANDRSVERPNQLSAYQQKLADQQAWISLSRPAQLNTRPAGETTPLGRIGLRGASIALADSRVLAETDSDSPIVPGMDDPHRWYLQHQTSAADIVRLPKQNEDSRESSSSVFAGEFRSDSDPTSDSDTQPRFVSSASPSAIDPPSSGENRKNLAHAIATAEAKWQPQTGRSIRSQAKSVLSSTAPNLQTNRVKNRVAKAWETGRY